MKKIWEVDLQLFHRAYINALLYSENMDEVTFSDISDETHDQISQDCETFWDLANKFDDFDPQHDTDYIVKTAHDFVLTRNGHGAGFWDGDWEEKLGEELTSLSKKFGEFEAYIGDDSRVYHMGGG